MKKLLFVGTFAALLASCSTESHDAETEEGAVVEMGESYGEFEVNPEEAITVEAMLADFADKNDSTAYTIEADLNEICSKMGCWVNIEKPDGETFMVRFKDHFTIPTETEVGTGAYLHGVAFNDTVSVDWLQHFAEDAGKSQEEIDAITEPKITLGFIADGITLKK